MRLPNYSQEQRAFLAHIVALLVTAAIDYFNPNATWAYEPPLVPKEDPAMFRFTVDLRPANLFTLKHQFPMPYLEQELEKLTYSPFFSIFDLLYGYSQPSSAKCSQQCTSVITADVIYTLTPLPQAKTNSVLFLQKRLAASLPVKVISNILWWL